MTRTETRRARLQPGFCRMNRHLHFTNMVGRPLRLARISGGYGRSVARPCLLLLPNASVWSLRFHAAEHATGAIQRVEQSIPSIENPVQGLEHDLHL